MIPCISTPFLNRPDLVQRMVSSIDFPVVNLLICNNSSRNHSLHELKVPECVLRWEERVGDNIGCAGGWNLALDHAFNQRKSEYVIIVGSDVQWAPGDLEKFQRAYEENPSCDFISGNHAFSTFAITRKGFGRLGWFDENIVWGYLEDSDMWRRAQLTPDFHAVSIDTHAIHGEAPTWGSSTIYSDPEVRQRVHIQHGKNWEYFIRKWGGKKEGGTEEYLKPFNDPANSLWDWSLDDERKKLPFFRSHG